MPIHDHEPSFRGEAFLWGGIGLGRAVPGRATHPRFGCSAAPARARSRRHLMVRQGDKIIVPEGSALRKRLSVSRRRAQPVERQAGAARAWSNPIPRAPRRCSRRSAAGCSRSRSRWGIASCRGQVLAVIDSPDLAQAYDDNDKAADAFKLAEKTLGRQEAQQRRSARPRTRIWTRPRANTTQAHGRIHANPGASENARRTRPSQAADRLLTVAAPVSGSITALAVAPGQHDQRSDAVRS